MNEIFATQEMLVELHNGCVPQLLNQIFDESCVITTQYSNYWKVTNYLHNESNVSKLNKVQVISLFILKGGRVDLDSNMHNFVDYMCFRNYVHDHHYISDAEYNFLNNHFMENGIVEPSDI